MLYIIKKAGLLVHKIFIKNCFNFLYIKNSGRPVRSSIQTRRSNRNKDTVMNDERERRRNVQWQDQQNRAQGLKTKRGFTEEQRRKGQETREKNSICRNCGQTGHFANRCQNDRVKLNRKIPNVGEFEPVSGVMNSKMNITVGQYLNENPSVKKKFRSSLKY